MSVAGKGGRPPGLPNGIACSWVSIRIYFRNSDDYVPRTAERLPGGAAQRELGKLKSAKTKAKKLFVFNEYAK